MKSRSSNEVTKNRSSDLVRPPVANGHAHHNVHGMASLPPVVLDAFDSPSRAINEPARSSFETSFGRDFSRVRVHTDPSAAESAETIGAHAYTVGENIFFGANRYAPYTSTGNQLLAHELAHVAQQQSSGAAMLQKFPGPPMDPQEAEANRMSGRDPALDEVIGESGSDSIPYAESQMLVGVSDQADPRGYSGPTEVSAPEKTEGEKTEGEKVKVDPPPKRIPVSETKEAGEAEGPEIDTEAKMAGTYSVGGPLKGGDVEQSGGAKIEAGVTVPGKIGLAGSASHKGVRAEGPEEAPETAQVTTFSLEGKLPVGQWIFGPDRLKRMGSFVALKELSLGVSFSRKQQQEEALQKIFRTKAFEYSLHIIGVTLEEKKVKLGLVSFEAGASFVGGVEGEQEGPAGTTGPTKRTNKVGGKGALGFKFFPRGGPFYIFVDATIEVKGSKQHGGVWMGSFEFTPMGGFGLNFGKLGKGKRK